MRYLVLLAVIPLSALAQKPEPDPTVLQALLSEVQQLRLAIERSTLLGTRTQLALTRLQMQEATAARLSQELTDVRRQVTGMAGHRTQLAEQIKDLESKLAGSSPQFHQELESAIKQFKFELEQSAATEQERGSRESELANQFQAAQSQLAETRARIDEMERSLDAAIQQMTKPRQ